MAARPGIKAKIITALEHGPKTAAQLAEATGFHIKQITLAVTKDRRRALRAFYILDWEVKGITLQPIYALGQGQDMPRPSPLTDLIVSHLTKNPYSTANQIAKATGVIPNTVRAMLLVLHRRGDVHIGDWVKNDGIRPVVEWVNGPGRDAPSPFRKRKKEEPPPPAKLKHHEIIERLRPLGVSPWQQLL